MDLAKINPSGWLISPCGEKMILFLKDPMSIKTDLKFYVDIWSSINGERNKFKSRRIYTSDDAIKYWNHLIGEGWNKIKISNYFAA